MKCSSRRDNLTLRGQDAAWGGNSLRAEECVLPGLMGCLYLERDLICFTIAPLIFISERWENSFVKSICTIHCIGTILVKVWKSINNWKLLSSHALSGCLLPLQSDHLLSYQPGWKQQCSVCIGVLCQCRCSGEDVQREKLTVCDKALFHRPPSKTFLCFYSPNGQARIPYCCCVSDSCYAYGQHDLDYMTMCCIVTENQMRTMCNETAHEEQRMKTLYQTWLERKTVIFQVSTWEINSSSSHNHQLGI